MVIAVGLQMKHLAMNQYYEPRASLILILKNVLIEQSNTFSLIKVLSGGETALQLGA